MPDGDLLIGGIGTQVKMGTGPDDRAPAMAYNSRLIARLGPDGRARWMHAVGGAAAYDTNTFTLAGETVWVAGSDLDGGGVHYDLGTLPGTPQVAKDEDAFLVGFALDTGEWRRTISIGGPGDQTAVAVAVDDDGNVYGLGDYDRAPLDLGGVELPWPWPGAHVDDLNVYGNAWLASWAPDGHLRWAVASPFEADLAKLGWAGSALLWSSPNETVWYPDPAPGGTLATLNGQGYSNNVYVVDPATGVVSDSDFGLRSSNVFLDDFGDPAPDGEGLTAVATTGDAGQWSSSPHITTHLRSIGLMVALGSGGDVTTLLETPAISAGGSLATRAFAGALAYDETPQQDVYLTASDFGFEDRPPDGVAGWLDEDGATECAWAFASDGQTYATDATRDARGGLVVVGWFVNSDLTVYDQQGDVVTVLDRVDGSPSQDAFALRFGWPDGGAPARGAARPGGLHLTTEVAAAASARSSAGAPRTPGTSTP